MSETTIKIEGMSCQHCVTGVKKAIGALEGIEKSDVSIGSAIVRYDDTRVKIEEIERVIENAGYKINRESK